MRRMRIFITTRVTHCKKSLYMAIILLLSCITLSSFDNNYNSHYQVLFVDSFWSNVFTWQQDNNVGWALEGKQQHRWAPRNTLLHALHSKSRDTIHYFKPWNPSYKTAWAQTLPLFAERGGGKPYALMRFGQWVSNLGSQNQGHTILPPSPSI